MVEPGFSSFPYGPIRGHGNILQSFTRASRFSGRSFTVHNPTYLPTQLTLCFTVCGRGGTAGEIAQVQPELDKPTLSPCHPVCPRHTTTPVSILHMQGPLLCRATFFYKEARIPRAHHPQHLQRQPSRDSFGRFHLVIGLYLQPR